jgi:hypothetical protein
MGHSPNSHPFLYPQGDQGDGLTDLNGPIEFKEINTKGNDSQETEVEEIFQRGSFSIWDRGSGKGGEAPSHSAKCSPIQSITVVAKRERKEENGKREMISPIVYLVRVNL